MEVEAGLIKIFDKLFAVAIFNNNICTHYLYNDRLLEELIEDNKSSIRLQVPEYLSDVIIGCDRKMWDYYSSGGDIIYEKITKYQIEDLMKLSLNLADKIKKLNA